jgi:hypothetical protein
LPGGAIICGFPDTASCNANIVFAKIFGLTAISAILPEVKAGPILLNFKLLKVDEETGSLLPSSAALFLPAD